MYLNNSVNKNNGKGKQSIVNKFIQKINKKPETKKVNHMSIFIKSFDSKKYSKKV
jgi:hypothetical protein